MNGADIRFVHLGITIEHLKSSISVFGFRIAFYGIIIGIGMLAGIWIAQSDAKRRGQDPELYLDFALYAIICSIVGARIYYVIFEWGYYSAHPAEIVQIWNGGLAIYGGIIGALIGAAIGCKVGKIDFRNLLDLGALGLLIGQGIGRWGNFFNQEAFGTNTDTALFRMWSVKIRDTLAASSADLAAKGVTVDPEVPVHPTFLYESLWCVLGFLILNYIVHKHRSFKGEIFVLYGVWYGVERMVVEGMRTDSLYIGSTSIRVSQVLSAVIAVVALVYFIVVMVKKKQGRLPQRLRVVPVEELPPRPTKEERRAAQAAKRSKTKNKGVNEEKNGTDH